MGAGSMLLAGFPLMFLLLLVLPLLLPRPEWKMLAGFGMMLMLLGFLLFSVRMRTEAREAVPAMPEAVPKVPDLHDNG